MSEEQSSFKVTDRRLFNPDGSPRELTPEERQASEAASSASAAASRPRTEPVPPRQGNDGGSVPQTGQAPTAAASQPQPEEAEEFDVPDSNDPASFVNFIMSIASNAASSLGMMEHPVTHQREVDLELAKHWIDVLGMLHQKTKGNLTSQEQQILEGLLSDLRLQFVSLSDSASAKASRPYTGRDIIGGK